MPYLVVKPSEGEQFRVPLEGQTVRVGRSQSGDICLAGDAAVSRLHAEITFDGGRWSVRDLGSHNGTFLDDQQVTSAVALRPGARIRIGRAVILFSGDEGKTQPHVRPELSSVLDDAHSIVLPVTQIMSSVHESVVPTEEAGQPELQGAQSRAFAVLSRGAAELLGHRPLEEVLELFLDLVFQAMAPERGAIMLLEGDPPKLRAGAVRGMIADGDRLPMSTTIANLVLNEQQSVLTANAQIDDRFAGAHSIGIQSIQSVMCVPLWNNKEVIGLIYADTVSMTRPFAKGDLEVLTLLANVGAVKIDNVRLFQRDQQMRELERELRAAAKIQRRLLPEKTPELPGYEIHGFNRPCFDVGGDYFDFIARGGKLGIAIGDVAGKGMGAALLMATLQAALRAHTSTEATVSEIVSRVNDLVCDNSDEDKFITFFYGELEPETGLLRFVNAGHNPPLMFRKATGEIEELRTRGLILGFQPGIDYAFGEVTFVPGDLLALFSDGVTESQNEADEEFGEQRLIDAIRGSRDEPVATIWEQVDAAVEEFIAGAGQFDDFTLSLIKRSD